MREEKKETHDVLLKITNFINISSSEKYQIQEKMQERHKKMNFRITFQISHVMCNIIIKCISLCSHLMHVVVIRILSSK